MAPLGGSQKKGDVQEKNPYPWNHFYRPHPKDDGRLFFHFVCQSTPGGGVPGLRFSGGPRFSGGSQIFRGFLRFFGRGGGGVPGLSKGKNFWHQIWLDTCSDWEKIFCQGNPPPRNSKKLLWLHGRRYASCVHAGGLSCLKKTKIPFLGKSCKIRSWRPYLCVFIQFYSVFGLSPQYNILLHMHLLTSLLFIGEQ